MCVSSSGSEPLQLPLIFFKYLTKHVFTSYLAKFELMLDTSGASRLWCGLFSGTVTTGSGVLHL